MKTAAGMVVLAVLALTCGVTAVGCGEDGTETTSSGSAALAGQSVLACSSLVVERGSIGKGQSASALAVRDQSGTSDDWTKYVEFAPNTSAVCTYRLPAGTTSSGVSALSLRLNYRGPTKQEMPWRFEVFDAQASSWVVVGDNAFAADWKWSPAEIAIGSEATRFFAGDVLKVRYVTSSTRDASQLDELVVLASTSSTTTTTTTADAGGGASTDAGASTDTGTTTTTDSGSSLPPPTGTIWRPAPGTTWQWQLTGTIDTSVNASVFDIDLFETPQATIDQLHAKGRKVVCYFDTTYEPNRPDSAQLAPYKGNPIKGWPGQYWIDIRQPAVLTVMKARIALAKQKACDGLEADDVDSRSNNPGFPITAADQQGFIRALAAEGHSKGMSFALKNDLEEIPQLLNDVDFAVNEECLQFSECGDLSPFITAGKAVFHVEYGSASLATTVCPKTKPLGFSTLIKNLDLDAWRVACP